MSELDRAVAELLGWIEWTPGEGFPVYWAKPDAVTTRKAEILQSQYTPSTDANQAQAAVREWCGEDEVRQLRYTCALFNEVAKGGKRQFRMLTATPEQLCRALLAAAKEIGNG